MLLASPVWAFSVVMHLPAAFGPVPQQIQTRGEGNLTPDASGAVTVTNPADFTDLSNAGWETNRQYHSGSTNAVVSNSVLSYFPLDGSGTGDVAATIGDASTLAPGITTIKNLSCALYTAGGVLTVAGGTSYVLALAQNGTATALTCTITAAISSCTDTGHAVTTAALDQLEFIDTPNGSPTALVPKCTVEVDF